MIRVVTAEPMDNYLLKVRLSDGRQGIFDVKPYLEIGVFQELKDPAYFCSVQAAFGGVVWPHEQDLSPETIECKMLQEVTASLPSAQEQIHSDDRGNENLGHFSAFPRNSLPNQKKEPVIVRLPQNNKQR